MMQIQELLSKKWKKLRLSSGKLRTLMAVLILLFLVIWLTSCATPTAPRDPRLTEPCKMIEPEENPTYRQLIIVLIDQWQAVGECNSRLKILRN